jgi:hypothetical protein
MLSTEVFAGTVTVICLISWAGVRLPASAFAATSATVLDWTSCASLSMLTLEPVVRLPATIFSFAALGVTYTEAVAVYALGAAAT